MPGVAALGEKHRTFNASGKSKARFRFKDRHLNKLEIDAIYIDSIKDHGIAVGALARLNDYLMAFLQWRAILLSSTVDLPEPAKDESVSCDSRSNDSIQNDCDGRIAAQYDTGAPYACQAEQLRGTPYSLSGSPVHGVLSTRPLAGKRMSLP